MADAADFIVIGAGSAGCAVAAGLAECGAGSVLVVEAGPSDMHPLVKMPFGLVWLMGGKRDWRLKSTPQPAAGGRQIGIPRGRMVGGSGSINSMVWFRGRADDFDGWQVPGWAWSDVRPAFEEVEAKIDPRPLADPHPLVRGLSGMVGRAQDAPTREAESAGPFTFNLHDGRRWSAADAFLRPTLGRHLRVMTGREVARIAPVGGAMRRVEFTDGTSVTAGKGIILSAGSIGSPEILLRSGIGPAEDLRAAGVNVVHDAEGVGANLHDHPGAGLHFAGRGSGHGLTLNEAPGWLAAPFLWALAGRGTFASPTVEGGAFFDSTGQSGVPDVQSHFIPFHLAWQGSRYAPGQGYFADVCVCRPKSRGRLKLTKQGVEIDLGLLTDEDDLDTLVRGLKRLRALLAEADFSARRAPEAFPGAQVQSDDALRDYVRNRCGTAYHPVGTLRMGEGDAPVSPGLSVNGADGLWVADASVMPRVTSANTNAPSMMIGHRAAIMIAGEAR